MDYRELIRPRMSEYRFLHSCAVAEQARHLAEIWGADPEKAFIAGMVHDICKDMPKEEQLKYITDNGIKVEYKPVIVDGASIRLTNEKETERILSELEERNKSLKDGSWYDNFRKFALSLPRYQFVPEELQQKVAHFIDCEAHADIMREVYQTFNITNELD